MLSHSVVRAVCGAGERRERDEEENIAGGVQASQCVGQGFEILNFKKVVKRRR